MFREYPLRIGKFASFVRFVVVKRGLKVQLNDGFISIVGDDAVAVLFPEGNPALEPFGMGGLPTERVMVNHRPL